MNQRLPRVLFGLLLCAASASAWAQKPKSPPKDGAWLSVSAKLRLTEKLDAGPSIVPKAAEPAARLGAPFTLIIEAQHAPGYIALLPEALDLGDSIGERPAARKHQRSAAPGQSRPTEVDLYELQLIAFEPGVLEIPPIPLAMGATTAKTRALEVLVMSGFGEEEQAVLGSTAAQAAGALEQMAAQDPQPATINQPDYTLFWGLGITVLIGLIALVIWRLTAGKPTKVVEPPPPPPRPAYEVAMERIEALKSSELLSRGGFKPYFSELSELLREYTGGRYGFDSLDLTHDELMRALRRRQTPGLEAARLSHILNMADQVKFAKFLPEDAECQEALEGAEAIVRATAPREEEPDETGGES